VIRHENILSCFYIYLYTNILIYSFINSLGNEAVSSSDNTASDDRKINERIISLNAVEGNFVGLV
jgi:hypothetical protein